MDSPQPHSAASKGFGFLSVALAIISRLFLVLVVYPAVGFFMLVGFASDWSFTGVGRLVTDIQYEAQQAGKAEAPGHLLAKRCTDESQAHETGVWGAMEPKTNVSSESHRKGAFRSPAHPPGITL
ncbi:hypothetical protein V0R52_23650 [Pseudomonas asiatica]|uniref:hypothetical protein n=1 Tax=Pseudomonas asiatica TaxID=2219225 RepID=UPI002E7BEFFF|nr:hypothetical protein [Pseudomonas asiatica]MEE1919393.1 hypothetical protein [Pseudomonas asiatica]